MWKPRKMAVSAHLLVLLIVTFSLNQVEMAARASGRTAKTKTGKNTGNSGKSSGFWGAVNYAFSFLGGVDNEPSYGKLFQYERNLQAKFKEMEERMSKLSVKEAREIESVRNPIKFPEATSFSSTFIRDIGCLLEFWTDFNESKKTRRGIRKLSQHILWSRTDNSGLPGSKGSISYFIYRPSFEAELDSSTILPHLKYHAEAQETFAAVLEMIEMYPNDQIIFVGLLGGGAIAMLHSWMAVSSNPILFKNLKDFNGELHQIKVLLFDSDCVLSETYALNFPIPSWDILRFYSGFKRDLKPDSCKFESMTPVGLAYPYAPSMLEYWLPTNDPIEITRTQFLEYYAKYSKSSGKASAILDSDEEDEEIDNGIEEVYDDTQSVTASEISMSVDEHGRSRTASFRSEQRPSPSVSLRKQRSSSSVQVDLLEEKIKPGTELLKNSVEIAQFFYKNLKKIYRNHRDGYLKRNVNVCAASMEKSLKDTLTGVENDSPMISQGIKEISCFVKRYDPKTKVALIVCNLIGKDSISSSILQFRTSVHNEMDKVLFNANISVDEDDLEGFDDFEKISTDSGTTRSARTTSEDVLFDDRSVVTGFQEKSELWTSCLEELFKKATHLNAINPFGNHFSSAKSTVEAESNALGRSVLAIKLPFSSSYSNCEYTLLAQPKNFYQLFSVSSSMFFSIFSSVIETSFMPPVCSRVLEPPSIPHNKLGNAEFLIQTLNGYFNYDGTAQIDYGNTIVKGLEIVESTTNLMSRNPYDVFTTSLCNKLAECLPKNAAEKLYDCTAPLTLWSGRHHCPAVCLHRPGLHLCSRVVDCGEGVFLGFRDCKSFGVEKPLSDEFEHYYILNQLNPQAYYAAFHMNHVEGWQASLRSPFRFAVFMSEAATRTFLNENDAGSIASVSSTLKRKTPQFTAENLRVYQHQQERVKDQEEDEYTYDEAEEEAIDDRYEQVREQENRTSEEELVFDLMANAHDEVPLAVEVDNDNDDFGIDIVEHTGPDLKRTEQDEFGLEAKEEASDINAVSGTLETKLPSTDQIDQIIEPPQEKVTEENSAQITSVSTNGKKKNKKGKK